MTDLETLQKSLAVTLEIKRDEIKLLKELNAALEKLTDGNTYILGMLDKRK